MSNRRNVRPGEAQPDRALCDTLRRQPLALVSHGAERFECRGARYTMLAVAPFVWPDRDRSAHADSRSLAPGKSGQQPSPHGAARSSATAWQPSPPCFCMLHAFALPGCVGPGRRISVHSGGSILRALHAPSAPVALSIVTALAPGPLHRPHGCNPPKTGSHMALAGGLNEIARDNWVPLPGGGARG